MAAVAAAVSALLFHRLLLGSNVYASNDLVDIVWPFRIFIDRALATHQVPLWIPDVWMGVPFLADNDVGLLYPFQFPYLLRPADLAVGWVLWLHAWLSVCTMYAYCRLALRLHPLAAFGAGIVFAFNGYALAHTGLPWSPYEGPWPPLLFLALHRAVEGRFAWAWLGPPTVALALLGGQSQHMYWTALWLAPYAAVLLMTSGLSREHALKTLAWGAIVVLGGALLAAVQLLPEAELLANGVRLGSGLSFSDATIAPLPSMPPWRLLMPDRTYIGEGAAWIGLVATVLVVVGIAASFGRRSRRALVLFFLAMAASSYVLALGAQTPLYRLVFDVVPGMHQLRLPVRWLYPMTVAMAPLVGIGLDEVLHALRPVPRKLPWVFVVAFCLAVGPIPLLPFSPAHHLLVMWDQGRWLRLASLLAVTLGGAGIAANLWGKISAAYAAAAAVLAIVLELFAAAQFMEFNHPTKVDYITPRPIPAYVAAHGPGRLLDIAPQSWSEDPGTGGANTGLLAGAQSVTGYSSSWPTTRGGQLDAGLVARLREDPAQTVAHLNLLRGLGIRYLVATREQPALDQSRDLVRKLQDGPDVLYELAQPGSRTWTSCGASFVSTADAALASVVSPGFTDTHLYLEGTGASTPSGPCGQATIAAEDLNAVTVRADLATSGWVVLADTWYPGWHATVDGREVDIRHANYFGRAVPVPAGSHTIRFEFRPMSFALGLVLSGLAVIAWAISLVLILRRRPAVID